MSRLLTAGPAGADGSETLSRTERVINQGAFFALLQNYPNPFLPLEGWEKHYDKENGACKINIPFGSVITALVNS